MSYLSALSTVLFLSLSKRTDLVYNLATLDQLMRCHGEDDDDEQHEEIDEPVHNKLCCIFQ